MSATLPTVDYVIACESVRPDLGNKLNILGFYGVLPRAHIRIAEWESPINLLFMVSTHGGVEKFKIQLRIKQPDASELVLSIAVDAEPAIAPGNAVIVFEFPSIAFKQEGEHRIEALVNDKLAYEKSFFIGKGLLDIPAVR